MVGLGKGPCDEAIFRGGKTAEECAKASQPWVLAATILGSSMAFIDSSVVGVAMPVMQKAFGASAVQMQWVNNAYLLFLSALVLLGGSIGDRVGRKKTFLAGIALFTLASVGCGLAPSTMVAIAARAIQGMGAALLVPSSLAILGATFSEQERGRAIGTWAGSSAIVTALAPVFGGWMIDVASWRSIFWINLPIALITVALTLRHMPETKDSESHGHLDVVGAALAALGLAGVTYGLSPEPFHAISLGVGLVVLALFVLREVKAKNPLVPPLLFRDRTFTGTNLVTLFLYSALSGAFFFIPFYLIQVKGFSATAAGATFLPFTVFMGGFSGRAGGLVAKFGAKLPLIVGPLTTGVGLLICSFDSPGARYWAILFPGIVLMGIGMTISVAPLTTAVMASVPQGKVGVASGINNAVARVAGLLAVTILVFVALRVFSSDMDVWMREHEGPVAQAIRPQLGRLAGITLPKNLPSADLDSGLSAVRSGFTAAFRIVLLISAGLCAAAGCCAFALVEGLKSSKPSGS